MNRLPLAKRAQILGMLVEGNSLRATSRLAGCSINTVTKLLVDVGTACAEYQDAALRNLPCKRVQCDEIWSFCYAKQRNVPKDKRDQFGYGDVWTWTALDPDTKLTCCWLVGPRNIETGYEFINDLASRIPGRVQVTTDGLGIYIGALEQSFGARVDYAMLVKLYDELSRAKGPERKYSPGECCGIKKEKISGNPDPRHVCTSHVERANLTMRMGMRRFTRLTNGFSKKVENHAHAVALHFMWYNFGRIHKSLKITPAMAAKVTDHVWSLEDIARLADPDSN